MGTVWRAYDDRLSRPVAVKILDAARSAAAYPHFAREARILARLDHPHIASVYDVGAEGDVAYLVMELVEGAPVSAVLAERERLPWPEAAAVCAQVADALATAHARGVVHRDVTAANVMLTAGGVKLVDFGISTLEGSPETDPYGNLVGTPPYFAPERLDGAPVAPACDVYAVGVLLHRCLTGRLPWHAATPQELLAAQREREPDPLPPIEGLPAQLAEVGRSCLARDPAERPAAAEIAAALYPMAAQTPAPTHPPDRVPAGTSSADPTQVMPTLRSVHPRTPAHAEKRQRRGMPTFGVVAVAVVASLALVWSLAELASGSGPSSPAVAAPVQAGPECAVRYQQLRDDGEHFAAVITVRHLGDASLDDWQLAFRLPGEQRNDPTRASGWRQDGSVVTSAAATSRPLPPGGSASLRFAGVHTGDNPMPTAFELDAEPCAVTLLGPVAAGTPEARPATAGPAVKDRDRGKSGDHGPRGTQRGAKAEKNDEG